VGTLLRRKKDQQRNRKKQILRGRTVQKCSQYRKFNVLSSIAAVQSKQRYQVFGVLQYEFQMDEGRHALLLVIFFRVFVVEEVGTAY
jgi:hypothetical protein